MSPSTFCESLKIMTYQQDQKQLKVILTFQNVECQWPRLRSHLIQVHLKMNREKRLYFAVLVFQTGIRGQFQTEMKGLTSN